MKKSAFQQQKMSKSTKSEVNELLTRETNQLQEQKIDKVNYIQQMLTHNEQYTSTNNIEETLSHLALQGWYDIDSTIIVNQLSATFKLGNTHTAHPFRIQHCQEEQFFRAIAQQVHRLRETQVR
jgi:hypothetical protein